MTREEIEQKIVVIIHEQKTLPGTEIPRTTPLSDAGIDSLDALSILFALEETFGVTIPDERARQIQTLDDMIETIVSLVPLPS